MAKVWKIDKPCMDCGVMMYAVYPGQRYCEKCRKARFLKKDEPKPKKLKFQDMMSEADKKGLQYASYCKKHGLYLEGVEGLYEKRQGDFCLHSLW